MLTRSPLSAGLSRVTCALLLLVLSQVIGCNGGESSVPQPQQATPPPKTEELDRNGHALVWPSGWEDVVLVANSAKSTFDVTGHFSTSRNACGYEAYGKVELEFWNQFAEMLNRAAKAEFVPEAQEYCVAWPDPPGMDGTVAFTLLTPTSDPNAPVRTQRELYYPKSGEICTLIADHRLSDQLLTHLNQFVQIADKKDCPNGWGH